MTTEEQMDLGYLREHLHAAELVPYLWDGEDMNLRAFRCKGDLVAWYGQGPGVNGTPYRDRAFYCRELAHLSRVVQPDTIVELGTSLGIGTCLLHWLNPTAHIVTVDISTRTYMPGDQQVEMGCLAKHNKVGAEYLTMTSWSFSGGPVDLCFIDADHSYRSVIRDSEAAWRNKASGRRWAIVWHDHNEHHFGVMQAVAEFCASKGIQLQSRPDSDTVWIMGEK